MEAVRIIVLIGPSGAGKSSVKQYLVEHLGAESAPKFTTRASRGTPEDERDFIFCKGGSVPTSDVLVFESYGAVFAIQLSAIERSIARGKYHVITAGDCATVKQLSGYYPGRVVCVLIYCSAEVLHDRLIRSGSAARAARWPRVEEEIKEIYELLDCVHMVINNSHSFTATHEQVDRLIRMLSSVT